MTNEQTPENFQNLGINQKILSILDKKDFKTPTPIQNQVISAAIEDKDIIGIAQTGTGKTLAFGVPMIQKIMSSGSQGLIMVPTRELAQQVKQAISDIGTPLGLRSAVIIGGVNQRPQVQALRQNPHIVIATPGRLDDLLNQKLYCLNKLSIITLDEADRMLDVGFLPQIKRILKSAPTNRQTMLFSATMPQSIESLASAFMKTPLRVEIAPQGTSAKNVEHELFVISHLHKLRLLKSLLGDYSQDTTLIFSRTKHGARKITQKINEMGHTATEIHSNRSQCQREKALKGFSNGQFRIMVATDIAARGIDVKQISLVINYDLPENSEDYVHRIGRTGRAGRSGKAISFVTADQGDKVKRIEKLINKSLPFVSHAEIPSEKIDPNASKRPQSSRTQRFGNRNQNRRSFSRSSR